jgi:hypothetical protein
MYSNEKRDAEITLDWLAHLAVIDEHNFQLESSTSQHWVPAHYRQDNNPLHVPPVPPPLSSNHKQLISGAMPIDVRSTTSCNESRDLLSRFAPIEQVAAAVRANRLATEAVTPSSSSNISSTSLVPKPMRHDDRALVKRDDINHQWRLRYRESHRHASHDWMRSVPSLSMVHTLRHRLD